MRVHTNHKKRERKREIDGGREKEKKERYVNKREKEREERER